MTLWSSFEAWRFCQEEREDAGKEEMEDVDSKPQLIQAWHPAL